MCEINLFYGIERSVGKKEVAMLIKNTIASVSNINNDGYGFFNESGNIYKKGRKFTGSEAKQFGSMFDDSKFVISHVRNATSGVRSDANSHPFSDGRFVIVHNGTITNFYSVRNDFKSEADVDSAIILDVIRKYYDECKSVDKAIKKACKKLSGSFSVFVYDIIERRLYYFRHDAFFEFALVMIDNTKYIIGSTSSENMVRFSGKLQDGFFPPVWSVLGRGNVDDDILYEVCDGGIRRVSNLSFASDVVVCGRGGYYNDSSESIYERKIYGKAAADDYVSSEEEAKIRDSCSVIDKIECIEAYLSDWCNGNVQLRNFGEYNKFVVIASSDMIAKIRTDFNIYLEDEQTCKINRNNIDSLYDYICRVDSSGTYGNYMG